MGGAGRAAVAPVRLCLLSPGGAPRRGFISRRWVRGGFTTSISQAACTLSGCAATGANPFAIETMWPFDALPETFAFPPALRGV